MKGAENEVANAFSRIFINGFRLAQSEDYEALAQAQIDANLSSAQLPPSCSSFPLSATPLTLLCDTSTSEPRPIVPPAFRRTIFEALHDLAHPGVEASVTLIASRFSWRGLLSRPFPLPMPTFHTSTWIWLAPSHSLLVARPKIPSAPSAFPFLGRLRRQAINPPKGVKAWGVAP